MDIINVWFVPNGDICEASLIVEDSLFPWQITVVPYLYLLTVTVCGLTTTPDGDTLYYSPLYLHLIWIPPPFLSLPICRPMQCGISIIGYLLRCKLYYKVLSNVTVKPLLIIEDLGVFNHTCPMYLYTMPCQVRSIIRHGFYPRLKT